MRAQLFGILLALLTILPMGMYAANNKPFVIPELKDWKGSEGTFTPSEKARIVCDGKDAATMRIAHQFAADYETLFSHKLEVVQGKTALPGDFLLRIVPSKKAKKEEYTLKISDRAVLTAPETKGLYWGTRTLLQLSEQQENRSLPKGVARDYPDYAVRGFMIDCGRKFIPMQVLRDYVKTMSYYKMNTLQVHLNDNGFKQYFNHDWMKTYAAFRLECDTYPGLTARDGSYTKKEFVALQLLADSAGVEIIPEIDAPAHALALTQYKPEIGSEEYGMDHLDLFKPETYAFMDGLYKEYLEGEQPIFRGKRVHIGTDEYSNKKKEVVEKFRSFTDYYIRLVESYGKQACVWGALTHAKGDTPVKSENVVMAAWYNGYAAPKEMIEQGYQLISVPDGDLYIVPAAGYYYDYLNTEAIYKNWTPAHIGDVTFDERNPQILGGMFAVWNDHAGNGISVKDIHHRVFPALQTLAVKMWTGKNCTLPYDRFNTLRAQLSEAPGVNMSGRIGKTPSCVYSKAELQPGSHSGLQEIGYDYTVSFDVKKVTEPKGTELFRSDHAVFYLSDPIEGKLGFARDGYLNTFNYILLDGEQASIAVSGDNKSTRLYVNGKLKEELDIQKRWFNAGKDSMNYVRTLVFPLEKAGAFNSKVSDLKVYNYKKK
ncbi:MAG: family 20 glycosylhydrolase [Tannerellaceae bacterium]